MPELFDTIIAPGPGDLSPAELAVAEAIAVIGENASQTQVVSVLAAVGAKSPETGKRWTGQAVKDCIRSLRERGLLETPAGRAHRITSPLADDLLIALGEAGRLAPLALAQTKIHDGYSYGGLRGGGGHGYVSYAETLKADVKLRVLLFNGETAAAVDHFAKMRQSARLSWGFLRHPGRERFLRALPGETVSGAGAECIDMLVDRFEDAAHLLPLVDPARSPEACASAGFYHLMRGDTVAAEALAKQMAGVPERAQQAGSLTLSAAVAAMRGEYGVAAEGLADAMAALRKGTRKRKVFPAGCTALLPVLALLDSPSEAKLARACEYHRYACALWPEESSLFRSIGPTLAALSGQPTRAPYHDPDAPPSLGLLFFALACLWDGHAKGLFSSAEMAAYSAKADAGGYRWVAAEAANIAERLTPKRGARADAAQWLDGAGFVSLCDLLKPAEPWEKQLLALEGVAKRFKPKNAVAKAADAGQKRIAWVLRPGSYYHLVEPFEQGAMKNGRWKKGRKIALTRLIDHPEQFPYATEADLAVARSASGSNYGWGNTRYDVEASDALPKLVGHPALYVEDSSGIREEITLCAKEIVLSVTPERGGRKIKVKLEPEFEPEVGCQLERLGEGQFAVTEIRQSHVAVEEVLGPKGISVPESALDRVLDAIAALSGELRVVSEIAGAAGSATTVEADPVPTVFLKPFEEGLTAQARVCPIPDGDLLLAPGEGAESVFAQIGGKPVQAVRDLPAERTALKGLIAAAPGATTLRLGNEITFADPEDALELLADLHAASARMAWPEDGETKIRASVSAAAMGLKMKSSGEWFSASASLQVDPKLSLDMARLVELLAARPRSRFLRLDDGSYLALTEQLRKGLDDFVALSAVGGDDGARLLHPFAAAAIESAAGEANVEADRAWKAFRKNIAKAEAGDPEVPSTLTAELRGYQTDGYKWLARLAALGAGACLADDMGLGKTVQALALLVARAPDGPALVIAPTSVAANWLAEAARFAPTLRPVHYTGAPAARAELLEGLDGFDLVVTTYGLLQNDIAKLAKIKWHTAVLDEAQAIKNAATKRATAARKLRAGFRVATTGTPIENHLGELHSLFEFLLPGLLGDRKQFAVRFGAASEAGPAALESRDRLRRLISPFILRRLKSDVLTDLPSRTEITLHVELPDDEAAFYDALRQRAAEKLAEKSDEVTEAQHRVQILAELTKLRRACCHPSLIDGAPPLPGAKLELFASTVAELREAGHKTLVFSQFVGHLKILRDRLDKDGVSYQYLDGSTPAATRGKRVKAFQAGDGDVFLISLKAGGTGLNLTAADYVIHTDPWWNPAVEDQASDRAHRIGQTRPVTIYRLITKGTVEEKVLELHARKRDLAAALLAGTDTSSTVSAGDLLALIEGSR